MPHEICRQGDVLIVPADMVPRRFVGEAKEVKRVDGRLILAAGEVTGHHHAISDAEVSATLAGMEVMLLEVGPAGATLRHEEHGAIAVAPGGHARIVQKEYTPGALRSVAD